MLPTTELFPLTACFQLLDSHLTGEVVVLAGVTILMGGSSRP